MSDPKPTHGGRRSNAGRKNKQPELKKERVVLYALTHVNAYLNALEIEDEEERKKESRKRHIYAAAHLEVYVWNKTLATP